ncbi:unknown [Clostridium sp. CAG:768]|nr:unknown [Clostridium sp. CAG:768]
MKKELIQSIREKEIQLAKLKEHIEKSSVCSDLYNKVVLEKAILKKELENSQKNKIIENIKNLIPRKKTLICDYFKK